MANQNIVSYKFRPKGKGSAEIVLASESGCSWPYFANITALFRRHTMMVFHKVSSVAGWMGKENRGDWKIVLSSRCRNYIIALYTLLSWQQPLCSTAGKKNSYWVYRFLLRQEPRIFVSILQEALGIISFAENEEKKEKYISNRIIYLCSI